MLNCSKQISATQKAEHFFQDLFSHCCPYKTKRYPLLRRLIGFLKAPVFVSPSSHLHGHSLRQKGLGVWGRNKHWRGRNLKCRNNDSRQNTTSFRPPPYSLLKCFMDRRKEQPPPSHQLGFQTRSTLALVCPKRAGGGGGTPQATVLALLLLEVF